MFRSECVGYTFLLCRTVTSHLRVRSAFPLAGDDFRASIAMQAAVLASQEVARGDGKDSPHVQGIIL